MARTLDEILTVDDLTQVLKVNRRTIYRMLETRELPFAMKIKGHWRFKAGDLDQWLEAQKLVKNA